MAAIDNLIPPKKILSLGNNNMKTIQWKYKYFLI